MSTKKGYFVLADITGFTSFVAGTELEHSQLILSQILNLIVNKFTPQFNLVEIEGDAVFLYAPIEKFSRGEIILDLIEATYFDFRDTKVSFGRLAVCDCKACEMSAGLDLKFIFHSGDYVLNDVAGKAKPLGTSVNFVHRLSKNKVTKSTGWKAYILFTKNSIDDLGIELHDVHRELETYEHLGDVQTISLNLDVLYNKFSEARVEYISEVDADYYVEKNYSVPPQVLWEWLNNPKKRSQWLEATDWNPLERPFGRTGTGATNHCSNSNFIESLLDYRPFRYYTSEIKGKNIIFKLTARFDPITTGTKFKWLMTIDSSLPRWIRRYYGMFMLKFGLKIDRGFKKLEQLLETEKSIQLT